MKKCSHVGGNNFKFVSKLVTYFNFFLTGKISMCWTGTRPRLIIMDPEMMIDILYNKLGHYQKPPLNPLILILTRGLTTLEGEQWAKRRRIVNPAFHLERLKVPFLHCIISYSCYNHMQGSTIEGVVLYDLIKSHLTILLINLFFFFFLKGMIPVFTTSCRRMIKQWQKMVSPQQSYEADIWPELQKLTADVISRAAFGSNYEEGKLIFELQKELILLVLEAMQTLYIPGFR